MDRRPSYGTTEADHAPGAHPQIDCDGTEVWRTYGTPKGHVGPGITFICWGAWWTFWVLWTYLRGGANRFQSRSWYGPKTLMWGLRYLEPFMKVVGPLIISYIELYGDHDQLRTLTCPRNGRFAMTHMNNIQHASGYPGFLLAGLLDWVAMFVELPQGLQQLALAGAFYIESFLMANHKKHEALDQSVHHLLMLAMRGCAVAIAAEAIAPRSVLVASGRAFFALLQGAWLVQIAHIMWGADPRWSLDYPGSAMMPPVYFVWICVSIAATMCTCYVLLAIVLPLLGRTPYSLLPTTRQDVSELSDIKINEAAMRKEAGGDGGGGSFSSIRPEGSMHMRTDSANESRPSSPTAQPSGAMAGHIPAIRLPRISPFSIMAQRQQPDDW